MVQRTCTDGFQAPQLRRFFIVSSQSYGGVGWAASGWLSTFSGDSRTTDLRLNQTLSRSQLKPVLHSYDPQAHLVQNLCGFLADRGEADPTFFRAFGRTRMLH